MNLKDTNLSLQFYNYLCDIIGSVDVVQARRDIFDGSDIFLNTAVRTFISSGSKAEGLDLNGSDYDRMYNTNIFRVYESLNNVKCNPYKILLVMDTSDIKPGFTKIKLVNKLFLYIDFIHNWCETVGEETYISSKRFREQHCIGDMVIHGPCTSSRNGDIDYAFCFRCNERSTQAQQWIHRSRTTWSNYTLATSVVQYGVLFVPIGCKNSPSEDLQWRISFSVTEKLLIHSYTHTQLLCYALMKILLKDLIKPRHGELLCSYFLKTIMFWLSEEINPSKWKPENMISCFYDCMRRLIYCVEYKTCLHYFIPENNLFEDRFTDNDHKALLNTLWVIYESPLMSVFETFTFQKYRLESVYSYGMILSVSELSCYSYIHTFTPFISASIFSRMKRVVKFWFNKELCTYMLSVYAREALQSSHYCYMMSRNKSFYKQYIRILSFFKINLRAESISSWLLQASLFYNCKRFQESFVIINYCLSRCTPNMINLSFKNSLVEQTVFKKMKHRYGLLLTMKHLIIDTVCFRHPFSLLPDELIPLIVNKRILFPPVVYSYLLQFLCCYHLGDNRGKQNALHDLELTIRERYFILNYNSISRIVHASLDIVKTLL